MPSLLSNALVVFLAIFLAELPDKTMFATLMLATRMRRPFAVWVGVSIAYCTHVVIAVLFGSALSKLPERPKPQLPKLSTRRLPHQLRRRLNRSSEP
ncbi:MAG: TMEM165/GDT1 family protein [Actinobacteria bacterium]|nr:TMEM165/GDT1 family protein [Actinomycetota bacterium]